MKKQLRLKRKVKNFLWGALAFIVVDCFLAIMITMANDSLDDMYRKCDTAKGRACTYYEAYRMEHPAE